MYLYNSAGDYVGEKGRIEDILVKLMNRITDPKVKKC